MRLGYFITKFPPITGGGESHIELVAGQMAKRGHEVHIITAPHPERSSAEHPYIIHEIDGLTDAGIDFSAVASIVKILENNSFDILHVVNYEALLYYSFIQHSKGITKIIFSTYNTPIHGKRIFGGIGNNFQIEKQVVGQALKNMPIDRFIVNSEAFQDGFNDLGVSPEKTTRIDFGIDLDIFKPGFSKKQAVDSSEVLMLCTSRFVSRKGIEFLIKSLDFLPTNYRLYLTGSGSIHDQATHSYLVSLAKQYKDRITLGTQKKSLEEMITLYRLADIFVMPSEYEGFGLTALEAMACGTPVIATRAQGLREFVHHGETGLLVDYASPEQIAKAAVTITNDLSLRNLLITKALQQAKEYYNVSDMINGYEHAYQQVAQRVAV